MGTLVKVHVGRCKVIDYPEKQSSVSRLRYHSLSVVLL